MPKKEEMKKENVDITWCRSSLAQTHGDRLTWPSKVSTKDLPGPLKDAAPELGHSHCVPVRGFTGKNDSCCFKIKGQPENLRVVCLMWVLETKSKHD